MLTRKKYRLKKRIKNFLVFYSFICVFFIASYTFSRYINTTTTHYKVGIAKFNVSVNDQDVINNQTFNLTLSPVTNTYQNKIAPQTQGYFEIIINPDGTEVSLEYEFNFNLSNIDSDVTLTKCVLNDTQELEFTDNIIKGELLLPNIEHGFTTSDTLNLKVYWQWDEPEEVVNPIINKEDTNIIVTSIIKQKIA